MSYFNRLTYTKNWSSQADFPTYEPNETQVRADLQLLHDEAKDALNALIDKLESTNYAANLPVSSTNFTAANLKAALEEVLATAKAAQTGTILDGAVTEAKLAEAVQAKLNASHVVYSMNDPTAGENPDAGYPAAKLWLRPPFTIRNLAPDWNLATGNDWTAVYGTKSVSGGALTLAGTADSRYGQMTCSLSAPAGHSVRVYLKLTAVAGQAGSLKVKLNGAETTLVSGDMTILTAAADTSGKVSAEITADWSNTQTAASSSIRLDSFAAVDVTALVPTGAIAITLDSLDADVLAALPLQAVDSVRAMFIQELPGVWTQILYDTLPVEKGGTGKKTLARNALLAGNGTDGVMTVPLPASGDQFLEQNADGTFSWKTAEEVVAQLGALRWGEIKWTGDSDKRYTAATREIALLGKPKLAYFANDNSSETVYYRNIFDFTAVFSEDVHGYTGTGNVETTYHYRMSFSDDAKIIMKFTVINGNSTYPAEWPYNKLGTTYTLRYLY
jgi:hypothetical protein